MQLEKLLVLADHLYTLNQYNLTKNNQVRHLQQEKTIVTLSSCQMLSPHLWVSGMKSVASINLRSNENSGFSQ